MTTGNGGAAQPQPQIAAPQLNVLAQYIKDFSFENPHSPRLNVPGNQEPSISVPISVSANPLPSGQIEVVLKIEGKAEVSGTVLFNFELSYGGVFQIANVPQESMQAVVMIECPRLLFPFAREIIAMAIVNGGFPPLLLNPPDFVGLYRQSLMQASAPPAANA